MPNLAKHEILVVDDDEAVRDSIALLLKASGYDTIVAENGLDALRQLGRTLPTVVISDLNMPEMSGFEFLSVVRRRFPHISVIAMSGAYHDECVPPGGLIADTFYPKGGSNPAALLKVVADLIHTSEARAADHQRESVPVWIPRHKQNSQAAAYVVLTCTDCLRSFPFSVETEDLQKIQETPCLFCPNVVRYIVDFSLSIASPRPGAKQATVAA